MYRNKHDIMQKKIGRDWKHRLKQDEEGIDCNRKGQIGTARDRLQQEGADWDSKGQIATGSGRLGEQGIDCNRKE